jgi:hypothetical protein
MTSYNVTKRVKHHEDNPVSKSDSRKMNKNPKLKISHSPTDALFIKLCLRFTLKFT